MDLFNQFDVDHDGTISYTEFLLVLVLVSVPLKDIQAIFSIIDDDDNGTITRHEFWDLVTRLRLFGSRSTKTSNSLLPKPGFTSRYVSQLNCHSHQCFFLSRMIG